MGWLAWDGRKVMMSRLVFVSWKIPSNNLFVQYCVPLLTMIDLFNSNTSAYNVLTVFTNCEYFRIQ